MCVGEKDVAAVLEFKVVWSQSSLQVGLIGGSHWIEVLKMRGNQYIGWCNVNFL
jgi:hypothetical protein